MTPASRMAALIAAALPLLLPASAGAAPSTGAADGAGGRGGVSVLSVPPGTGVRASRAADAEGESVDIARPVLLHPGPRKLAAAPARSAQAPPARMLVTAGPVSSRFGLRTHPVLGGLRLHAGVDLPAGTGTPVVATSEGTVRAAQWAGGYGLVVVVDHPGALQTRYGHLSRLVVAPGQRVRAGQVVGYVGSTGRSTGPHLHYEVRVGGRAVDPAPRRRGP